MAEDIPAKETAIEDADGIGEVGNAVCGDIMKIYLKIVDDTVADVKDYYDRHGISYDPAQFPDCESCGNCHTH